MSGGNATNVGRSRSEIYDSEASPPALWAEIRDLYKYRYMIQELTKRNLKLRYKRSLLGVAWTMVNPLLTMLVLFVVFSSLFSVSVPNYSIYLLSGLLLWNFFSQSTIACARDLLAGGGVLRRIRVPRSIFAVASINTGIVNILLALLPLALFMVLVGHPFLPSLFFLPVSLLVVALFALGVGMLLSSLAIGFTDVIEMFQILMLAWMYLTPVFYPENILDDKFQWILDWNPMYSIMLVFRDPIYQGTLPDSIAFLKALFWALLLLILGAYFFIKKSDQIPYQV